MNQTYGLKVWILSGWKGHWMSSKVSSRLKAIVQIQTVYNSTAFRNMLTKQIWWLGPSRQDATCFRLLPFYLSMFALRCFGLCPRFHLHSQISFLVFSFPSLSFLAFFFLWRGPTIDINKPWFMAITQHQQWPKIWLVGPVRDLWDLTLNFEYRLQTNACNPSDSLERIPCDEHFISHDLRIHIHQPLGCTVPCINVVSWWYIRVWVTATVPSSLCLQELLRWVLASRRRTLRGSHAATRSAPCSAVPGRTGARVTWDIPLLRWFLTHCHSKP